MAHASPTPFSTSPATGLATALPGDTTTRPVNKRRLLVAGGHIALWAGSFIALNQAWYADYPKSSFHFFNDNGEWNQMDKAGHLWTSYQMSRHSTQLWKWSGMDERRSVWLGGICGMAYQSIIEIQDGFSAEWGFSWGDMLANTVGAAAYVSQQLGWKDQRLQVKLSYSPYDYPADLRQRRDQLFGSSLPERLLKDYNSQTYWVSANLRSFFPSSGLPRWLNVSAGYAASGMLGGYDNKWEDDGVVYDHTEIERGRHYLLSVDVDLTKIPTNHKWLRSAFFILNLIKIPAPALELSSGGHFKAHALYF